jgi:hypothetical protein
MEKKTLFNNKMPASFVLKVLVLAFVIPLSFWACSDLVSDLELPDSEPKIVLHSFISPADSAVMVVLTWSNPINSNQDHFNPNIIDNAEVSINEKDKASFMLTFYPERKFYTLSTDVFPIQAGKEYEIKVVLPDGQRAEAECYVPHINESLEINDFKFVNYNEWEKSFQVEYTFQDPGVTENYYFSTSYLDSKYFDYYNYEWVYYSEQLWIISGNKFIHAKGEVPQVFLIRAETYMYEEEQGNVGDEEDRYIRVVLLTTDKHYYSYHKDLENYYPDDFLSEPTHIYSNVKGGRGVFAGYNMFVVQEIVDFE